MTYPFLPCGCAEGEECIECSLERDPDAVALATAAAREAAEHLEASR